MFELRFVIIKFFRRKIANQKEPWNQFLTNFSRSRPAIENPTSRNLKCLFVSFVFPFLRKNIMGHFNYYYPNGPVKSGADLGEILTVFQNERRRRKLLGGSEACTPWIFFIIFLLFYFFYSQKSLFLGFWVIQSGYWPDFNLESFFFHENLFTYENSDRFS